MSTEMETPTYYAPIAAECDVFQHCYAQQLPLMLKGPTGCGKSRFVEHMAEVVGRPLISVACHDDTTTADLVGRWLVKGGDTVWVDGPVTRAVREGAILYLDEVVEARPDVIVALHPLTDHRRQLFLERHNEVLTASKDFMLVVSFNPHYQSGIKELKASTRQRFVGISFRYPPEALERTIVAHEAGVDAPTAKRLVKLAVKLRQLDALGLAEPPSTRLLIDAGKLMRQGLDARLACQAAIAEPMSDDDDILGTLSDVIALAF